MDEQFEERPSDAPPGSQLSPELVKWAVREIDARSDSERLVLLSSFMCTAWPAPLSQMQ